VHEAGRRYRLTHAVVIDNGHDICVFFNVETKLRPAIVTYLQREMFFGKK
jgi:hypothetical protein